jgi:hypothetical protein
LLYGYGAAAAGIQKKHAKDLYGFINDLRDNEEQVKDFARKHGFSEILDKSGAQIDWQIIDTSELTSVAFHPKIKISSQMIKSGQTLASGAPGEGRYSTHLHDNQGHFREDTYVTTSPGSTS